MKTEYLKTLRSELKGFPAQEIAEILRDQEEYINDAIANGREEEDVLQALGEPKQLAQSLAAEARIRSARSTSGLGSKSKATASAAFAILALAPFNLIVVMGPYLAAMGIIIAGWAVSLALGFTGIAIIFPFLSRSLTVHVDLWTQVSATAFLLGLISGGVTLALMMSKITEWFLTATLNYLAWNLKFIRKSAA